MHYMPHRFCRVSMPITGLLLLLLVASSGCQVDVGGQTLPSPWYMTDDVQYFPPGPEFKLSREAAALKDARVRQQRRAAGVVAPAPGELAPPAAAPGIPAPVVAPAPGIAPPPAPGGIQPAPEGEDRPGEAPPAVEVPPGPEMEEPNPFEP
jgi:hypothetical protein